MALRFALNHMVAPRQSLPAFFDLARAVGVSDVEIRNDLEGTAILDGTPASQIAAEAQKRDLTIISINALQRFNQWSDERHQQAVALIEYAQACGAKALVLCPVNDIAFTPNEDQRRAGLRDSLERLAPLLAKAGLIGLVEPLGFIECSLRLKRDAVAAIDEVGGSAVFTLVHDTFHHHVAGETELFPAQTGLVHISGVADPDVPTGTMRDPHRVLVDRHDRIDNLGQIKALLAGGYDGDFSFEPFADEVATMPDIQGALTESMALIEASQRR